MWKKIAALVLAAGVALTLGAARPDAPTPNYPGGISQPNAGVTNTGKMVCPTERDPDPWVRINSIPRFRAVSAGTCIIVPTDGRSGMTIAKLPNGDGYYPNISSGFAFGSYRCPDPNSPNLCPTYPVKFVHDGYPTLSVKEWSEPHYLGNLATDDWLAPDISYTSYSDRCAPLLSRADVEVMIWFTHPGDIAVPDVGQQYHTWIDGRRWKIDTWETSNHCPAGEGWRLVLIMAPRMTNGPLNVHHVHLNKFFSYVMHQGWASKSYYLMSQNIGWEMHYGGIGNRIDNVSLIRTK